MSQSASRPLKNVNKVSTNQNQEKVENRFRGPKSFWYGLVSWYMSSRDHKLALKLEEGGSGFASLAVPFCHRTRFCLVQNESYAHTMRDGMKKQSDNVTRSSTQNLVTTLSSHCSHSEYIKSSVFRLYTSPSHSLLPGFQNNSSLLAYFCL